MKSMNTYTVYLGATPIACVTAKGAYPCFEAAKTIAEFTGRKPPSCGMRMAKRSPSSIPRIPRRAASLIGMAVMMNAALILTRVATQTTAEKQSFYFCRAAHDPAGANFAIILALEK